MKTSRINSTGGLLLAAVLLSCTGCWTNYGFNVGALGVPIPVSPFFQDQLEDQFWDHERYERLPILGPITSGSEPVALDPPSPDEVMRALERARPVEGGLPFFHEIQRNNVQMVVDPIPGGDYVDPVRVYPLIGPAQQHHCHYKCTIYFTEVTRVGWPIPYTTVDEDTVEVVYIDHNHLHMVGNVSDGPSGNY
ncbi:MAG: hypothetical protein KF708_04255 [Pirellulales bacterium]|nr:hypothetical protein [Pirellulales bacterium]